MHINYVWLNSDNWIFRTNVLCINATNSQRHKTKAKNNNKHFNWMSHQPAPPFLYSIGFYCSLLWANRSTNKSHLLILPSISPISDEQATSYNCIHDAIELRAACFLTHSVFVVTFLHNWMRAFRLENPSFPPEDPDYEITIIYILSNRCELKFSANMSSGFHWGIVAIIPNPIG